MRTRDDATAEVEAYSPAEERFNRNRRTAGLIVGPLAFAAVLLVPTPGLPPSGHRLLAILAMVAVLWVTEALPLPVTAMLGPMVAVGLRIAPARSALAPFADPIIFLFIGSFILAEAMYVHGLDRRLAFRILSSAVARRSPFGLAVAYAAIGIGVSAFVSNMATAAMLLPIGLAVVGFLGKGEKGDVPGLERFALALMLLTSFGPSIGGMATPVGTPPNLIGIGMIERHTGFRVPFFSWVAIGLPVVVILFAIVMMEFRGTLFRGLKAAFTGPALAREELSKLGPMSRGERNVAVAFGITILLWMAPGVLSLVGLTEMKTGAAVSEAVPESLAAMVGAILLFLLPIDWRVRKFTLSWSQAAHIDWGIILLYGGGLALGELAFSSGVAEWAGRTVIERLPLHTTATLTLVFAGFAILLSEVTSNTASATLVVPIAIAVAEAAGVRPIEPALAATLGASMGFILPVSTAPNALVYSSGYVPITAMMRHGVVLDVAAFVVIVCVVLLLGPIVF